MRVLLVVLALTASLAAPSTAGAFYGNGAEIVSAHLERLEQGDDASGAPALSRDGRYVAFDSRARNFFADDDPDPASGYRAGGLFRRDLESGSLVLVADGDQYEEGSNDLVALGAHSPSVSADGRFVVFSTAQQLVPADVNDNTDVYVRDMLVPLSLPRKASGAYTLVSARDGSDVPATYASLPTPQPGRNPGADVWRGAAISRDGSRVVFRSVEVASDLPAEAAADTPPDQLFVRDLAARTTRLVTRRSDNPAQPAGGAVGPAGISGDGTTVVWTGERAPAQTRFLEGEQQSSFLKYYLWQRVADGASAPTRRVTGGIADPDDPACPPSGAVAQVQTATGPCYGPLTGTEGSRLDIASQLPGLSDDGLRVAYLASSGPRPNEDTGNGLDVWITSMAAGVSRKAGSRELTREGTPSDPRSTGSIDALALSGDGKRIVVSTTRASWVLPALTAIGTFRETANRADVAVIDLAAGTVERVSRAYDGADTLGESAAVSISGDGERVAFASVAANLLFGDANEHQDVFAATRTVEPVAEAPPDDPPPAPPQVTEETPPAPPSISVKARRTGTGDVRLTVKVPGAGRLVAQARGRVRSSPRAQPKLRVVAQAKGAAKAAGQAKLTLRLPRRYRSVLIQAGRLAAAVKVSFTPSPAGDALSRTARVTFSLQKSPKR